MKSETDSPHTGSHVDNPEPRGLGCRGPDDYTMQRQLDPQTLSHELRADPTLVGLGHANVLIFHSTIPLGSTLVLAASLHKGCQGIHH